MHAPAMNALNPALQRLRQAGYKITSVRQTVLEVMQRLGGHVTSAQIIEETARVDASIGRASVFRTLDLLTRLAIVRPTYLESSVTPNYVMMPDGHHHHVVCLHCNRVMEVDECNLEAFSRDLEQRLNVRISGHLLEFYATCADCMTPSASSV